MANRALCAARGGPNRGRARAAIAPGVCHAAALQLWRRRCAWRRCRCVAARLAGSPWAALDGPCTLRSARGRRRRPASARARQPTTSQAGRRGCGGPARVRAVAAVPSQLAHVRAPARLREHGHAPRARQPAVLQPCAPRAAVSARRRRLREALRAKQCGRCLVRMHSAHTPAPRITAHARGRVHKCAQLAAGQHAGRRDRGARTGERGAFGYTLFWARVSTGEDGNTNRHMATQY
jgi:hypothetical protein